MHVDIEAVKDTIATTFDIPIERIGNDCSSQTLEKWDSIGHINLVMALEQRFCVQFSIDEIGQIMDLGSICEAIDGKARND